MEKGNTMIGKIILGKYEVTEKIGTGGMATVYKALQKNLNRYVALKIVNENFVDDNELLRRFIREAQDMARISHPNVVTVHDFGSEGDIHFIAMEYLEGENLSKFIRQNGRQDEYKTIKYMAPIADALDHIHKLDFIHRDVKSSNIFITSSGRPVLMDFGIAYHSDKTISDANTVLGTAEYMSPEQAKGSALDERTDLYSLGIVMYECLTGELPFRGESLTSTIYKVTNEEPVPPKKLVGVTPWLNNLIINLLHKNPNDRIETAREVYEILDTGLNTGSGKRTGKHKIVTPAKKSRTVKKSPKSKKKSLIISLLAIFVLLLTVPIILWSMGIFDSGNIATTSTSEMQDPATTSPSLPAATVADPVQALSLAYKYIENEDFEKALRQFMKCSESIRNSESNKQIFSEILNKFIAELGQTLSLSSLPKGEFFMGENGESGDNSPAHMVRLEAFQMTSYEITIEQFIRLINAFDCNRSGFIEQLKVFHPEMLSDVHFTSDGFVFDPETAQFPAYGITWEGANFFCKQLGGRLPTEAEWEYAATTGSDTKYSGSDSIDMVGWYSDNTKNIQNVGSKMPNAAGIFDMSGNVWEWCADYYLKNYYKQSTIINPKGPERGEAKVIRGGDIKSGKTLLSCTYRSFMYGAEKSYDLIGFRYCR